MKDIIRPGLILMAYGIVAGIALGLINSATAPKIAEQEEAARMAAIREVLPEAMVFDPDTAGEIEYLTGYADEAGTKPVGYVITALGNGFSSTIQTVVGVEMDFSVEAIEIVYQSETPGLGTRSVESKEKGEEPWFEVQFDDKTMSQLIVDKDGGEIESITGATITSRAIANSVAKAIDALQKALPAATEPDTSCEEEGEAHSHRGCPNFKAHHPEIYDSINSAEKEVD